MKVLRLSLLASAVAASNSIFTVQVIDWHLLDHPLVATGANVNEDIGGGDYGTLNVATGWHQEGHGVAAKYRFSIDIKLTPKRLFWNFSETAELAFFGSNPTLNNSKIDFFSLSRRTEDVGVVHTLRFKQLSATQEQLSSADSYAELLRSTRGAEEFSFYWPEAWDKRFVPYNNMQMPDDDFWVPDPEVSLFDPSTGELYLRLIHDATAPASAAQQERNVLGLTTLGTYADYRILLSPGNPEWSDWQAQTILEWDKQKRLPSEQQLEQIEQVRRTNAAKGYSSAEDGGHSLQ